MFEAVIISLLIGPPILTVVFLILASKCRKRGATGKSAVWVALAAASLLVFVGMLVLPHFARARCLSPRTQCQSNIHQFDLALQAYCYPPVENYPMDLSDLPTNDVSVKMFMCLGDFDYTHTHPEELGSISNAFEWTSYIYITCLSNGLSPAIPAEIPVIICPPMFHNGAGGNMLMGDHSCTWYSDPALVDRLIENPLCLYGNNPPAGFRGNLYVHVSKRLEKLSKGKYRSHAVTNWIGRP